MKVLSITDIKSKEQFKEWFMKLPYNHTPKKVDAIAERAMMYDKCIWSKYPKEGLDSGLNFFKFV